jgi:hypothetical protein
MPTKSGGLGEIQVNTPEMIYAKEPREVARKILGDRQYEEIYRKTGMQGGQGHKLYERARELAPGSPKRQRVEAKSREYYERIRQRVEADRSSRASSGGRVAGGAGGIARIMPGSLPAAEEASLLQTLGHIDGGTTPTGALEKKWGTQFKNRTGDLPGPKGAASPYLEYRVAPPAGTSGAGPLRVVVNKRTGETYYTWTHYGDTGAPAFVQIR